MSRIDRRRFLEDLSSRGQIRTSPATPEGRQGRATMQDLGLRPSDLEAIDQNRDGVIRGRAELSELYDRLSALDEQRPLPAGQLDRTEQMFARMGGGPSGSQNAGQPAAADSTLPTRQAVGRRSIDGTERDLYVMLSPEVTAEAARRRARSPLEAPTGRTARAQEPVEAYLVAMEAREAGQPKPAAVPGYLWNITAALERRGVSSADIESYLATGRLADWTDADGAVVQTGQQRLQTLEDAAQRQGSWTAVNTMTFLVNLRRAELHSEQGRLTTERDALAPDDPARAEIDSRIDQLSSSNTELRRFLGTIYRNATNARERRASASLVRGDRYAQQARDARASGDTTRADSLDARAESARSRGARMAHSEATYRAQFAHTQFDAARAFDLAAQAQIGRGGAEIEAQTRTNTLSETPPASLTNDDGTNTGNGVPGAERLITESRRHASDGGNNHRTHSLEGARQATLSRFHAAHLEQQGYFNNATAGSPVAERTPEIQAHAEAYVDARVGQGQAAAARLELYGPPESLSGAEALEASRVAAEHRQVADELTSALAASITSRRRWSRAAEQRTQLREANAGSDEVVTQTETQERESNEGVTRAADQADSWTGDTFKTSGEVRRDAASIRDAETVEAETNDQVRAARRRRRQTQTALQTAETRTATALIQSQRDTQYGDAAKLGLQRLGVDAIGDPNTYMGGRSMADTSARRQQAFLDRAASDLPEREGAARRQTLSVAGERLELSAYWSRSTQTEFQVRGPASRPTAPARLDRAAGLLTQVDATRTGLESSDPARRALTVGVVHQRAAQAEAESPYRPARARDQLRTAQDLLRTDMASEPEATRRAAHGRIGQAAIQSLYTHESEFQAIYESPHYETGVADEFYAMAGRHLAEDVSDDGPRTEGARRQLDFLNRSLAQVPQVFQVSASQMREGAAFANAQIGGMGHAERGANSAKMSVVGTGALFLVTFGQVDIREDMMQLTDNIVDSRQRAIGREASDASIGADQLSAAWDQAVADGSRFDFLHGLRAMSHVHDYDVSTEQYRASVETVRALIPQDQLQRAERGWLSFMVAGALQPEDSPVALAASLGGPAYGFDQAMQSFGHPDEAAVTRHAQSFVRHSADSLREASENVGWYVAVNLGLEVALGVVLTGGLGSGAAVAEAGNAVNAGRAGVQAMNAARTATMLSRAGTALNTLRTAHPVLSAMGATAVTGAGMMGASHLARRAFGANSTGARVFDAATNFVPFSAGLRMGGAGARVQTASARAGQAVFAGGQASLTALATPEIAQRLGVRSELGQAGIGLALNTLLMGGMAARSNSGGHHRQVASGAAQSMLPTGSSRLRSRQLRADVETFLRRTEGRVPTNAEATRLKAGLYRRLQIPEGRAGDAARGRVDATIEAVRIDRAASLGVGRQAPDAARPQEAAQAVARAADALYAARGGEQAGASRPQALRDASQALSARYAQQGMAAHAEQALLRSEAGYVAHAFSVRDGSRPALTSEQVRLTETVLARELPRLAQNGQNLEARLVADAGLSPTQASQIARSARARVTEQRSVTALVQRQVQQAAPLTDAEIRRAVEDSGRDLGLSGADASQIAQGMASRGLGQWIRSMRSPEHWTQQEVVDGFFRAYPQAQAELGGLSTAELHAAFGDGPYPSSLARLAQLPGFGAFVRSHPSEAATLFHAARELGTSHVAREVSTQARNGHASPFREAARQLWSQTPSAELVPYGPRAARQSIDRRYRSYTRPAGAPEHVPSLHLRPGPRNDHNGAFHQRGIVRRQNGDIDSASRPELDRAAMRPDQLRDSAGQPFTNMNQVLVFSAHGSTRGFTGMNSQAAAGFIADQIRTFNQGRPANEQIRYVCLDACDQGTRRLFGGGTNAQAMQRALNAELGPGAVTILAAREAGPLYGASHRTAFRQRDPANPSAPRAHRFRDAEYVPVDQQQPTFSMPHLSGSQWALAGGVGLAYLGMAGALTAYALSDDEQPARDPEPRAPNPPAANPNNPARRPVHP